MRGVERLKSIERSTGPLARALPDLPKAETVMIRLLRIAVYGQDDYFAQIFRNLGITEKAYHVLCLLVASQKGKASPSELSELVGLSRASMTGVLAVLEREGYVSRESGKTDGRRVMISITRSGRRVTDKITPEIVGPTGDAFGCLSKEEMSILDVLLRKLIVSFDDAKMQSSSVS